MIYIDFTIIMNLKLFSLFQGHPSDWLCKTDESIAEFCYLWQIFVLKLKKRRRRNGCRNNSALLIQEVFNQLNLIKQLIICHFLLHEIFPTQELNPGLLHCWQTLYLLSHQGSPYYMQMSLKSKRNFGTR